MLKPVNTKNSLSLTSRSNRSKEVFMMEQENKKPQLFTNFQGHISQRLDAANQIKLDTLLRKRQTQYYFPKELEALDLQRKDFNRDDYYKHLSHYYPPYIQESSWIVTHPNHRRRNSFPESINQIDPPPYETTMVQNEKPQLFINFRGKDERLKLLPHLKHHLAASEVRVVTDDDAIGEPLDILFKYIRRSRIVIVIFSPSYLESDFCLNELVEIRRCLRTERVDYAIPIFYNVNTSDVKNQTGDFKDQFLALQNEHPESIKKWKKALSHVCKFSGLSFHNNRSITELDFVKRIVERVDTVVNKIKAKDRNDSTNSLTLQTSQGEDYNRLSKELEALDLQRKVYNNRSHGPYIPLRRNPEFIFVEETPPRCRLDQENSKFLQRSLPVKLTSLESSLTRDHLTPQDWPHPNYRLKNSFPDNLNLIYHPSDETTVFQNHQFKAQDRIDNLFQDKMIVNPNQQFENRENIENNLERISSKRSQFINFQGQDERLYSMELEALDLENYNRDDYYNNLSRVVKESPSTPRNSSHLPYRRINSFPDNINQMYHSSCYETAVAQNHKDKMMVDQSQPIEYTVSIDNNIQRRSDERPNENISCCELMRYCFKLSLCQA